MPEQRLGVLPYLYPNKILPQGTKEAVFTEGKYAEEPISLSDEFGNALYNSLVVAPVKGLVQVAPIVGQAVSKENSNAYKFFDDWIEQTTPYFQAATAYQSPTEGIFKDHSSRSLMQGLGQGLGFVFSMMLPTTGISKALNVGRFGKYVVGTAVGTTQLAPIYYEEGIRAGLSKTDAARYASILSPISALSEYIGLEGIGNVITKPLVNQIRREAIKEGVKEFASKGATKEAMYNAALLTNKAYAKGFKDVLKNLGTRGLKATAVEGGQEFAQSYIEEIARQTYDTFFAKKDASEGNGKFGANVIGEKQLQSALQDGFFGGIIGFMLGSGGGAMYNTTFEESMFNVLDKSKDRNKAVLAINKDIEKFQKSGKITPQEALHGIELTDRIAKFVSTELPNTLTDPIARFQAYRLNEIKNDLNGTVSESTNPLLIPDYLKDQQLAVDKKMKELANTNIPISDFNGFLKELNQIEEEYKKPKVTEVKKELTDEDIQSESLPEIKTEEAESEIQKQEQLQQKEVGLQQEEVEPPEKRRQMLLDALEDTNKTIESLTGKKGKKAKENLENEKVRKELIEQELLQLNENGDKNIIGENTRDAETIGTDEKASEGNDSQSSEKLEESLGLSRGDVEWKYKSKEDLATNFKNITGDNIESAKVKMAGVSLRNGMREAGNLDTPKEEMPYTKEQIDMIDLYDSFNKKSPYLFHSTPIGNIGSIQKEGLVVGKKAKFEGVSSPSKISLAANEDVAKYYGKENDVILRIKKGKEFDDLEPDFLAGGEGAYTTGRNILPEDLEIKVGKKWIPLNEYKDQSLSSNTPSKTETNVKETTKEVDKQKRISSAEKRNAVGVETTQDIIAANISKVGRKSFVSNDDENNITMSLARTWLRKDAIPIDVLAKELKDRYPQLEGVSEKELIDEITQFIKDNPNGAYTHWNKRYEEVTNIEDEYLKAMDKITPLANEVLEENVDIDMSDVTKDADLIRLREDDTNALFDYMANFTDKDGNVNLEEFRKSVEGFDPKYLELSDNIKNQINNILKKSENEYQETNEIPSGKTNTKNDTNGFKEEETTKRQQIENTADNTERVLDRVNMTESGRINGSIPTSDTIDVKDKTYTVVIDDDGASTRDEVTQYFKDTLNSKTKEVPLTKEMYDEIFPKKVKKAKKVKPDENIGKYNPSEQSIVDDILSSDIDMNGNIKDQLLDSGIINENCE